MAELVPPEHRVRRTAGTLMLYASLGCLGFLLTGLGVILPELRAEYGLPRGEVALYPSALALGLLAVGTVGHRAARALGRYGVPVALTALVGGAAVLAVGGGRLSAGAGAVLLGLGGAGLIQLVPVGLHSEQGTGGTVAIGEANAVASASAVLAPLIIGAALAHGPGWRAGFLVPPLVAALVLIALIGRPRRRQGTERANDAGEPPGPAPRAFWGWWTDVVLVVAIEFCMLFWSVDYLRTDKGLAAGAATLGSAGFVLGMAVGRAATGPAVRLGGGPVRLMAGAGVLATAGFAVFWAVPVVALAITGLFVTGLGTALLYPVVIGQALATWSSRPERAAARCALASGLAIGSAPLVLGLLADAVELRTAMLLAPLLLLVFLLRCASRLSGSGRPPVAGPARRPWRGR